MAVVLGREVKVVLTLRIHLQEDEKLWQFRDRVEESMCVKFNGLTLPSEYRIEETE